METKLALRLTDKKFKYHSATSHTSADGLKDRMKAYKRKTKKAKK
ncbi:MAG: hypothetical protein RLZZ481_1687 [Pseudomonadota bacterium]|jgi:hypothetical protein